MKLIYTYRYTNRKISVMLKMFEVLFVRMTCECKTLSVQWTFYQSINTGITRSLKILSIIWTDNTKLLPVLHDFYHTLADRLTVSTWLSREHFVYVPSQWEKTLHCNVVSHWLGAYTKYSLLRVYTETNSHIKNRSQSKGINWINLIYITQADYHCYL